MGVPPLRAAWPGRAGREPRRASSRGKQVAQRHRRAPGIEALADACACGVGDAARAARHPSARVAMRLRQRLRIARLDQQAVDAVVDHLGNAGDARARPPARPSPSPRPARWESRRGRRRPSPGRAARRRGPGGRSRAARPASPAPRSAHVVLQSQRVDLAHAWRRRPGRLRRRCRQPKAHARCAQRGAGVHAAGRSPSSRRGGPPTGSAARCRRSWPARRGARTSRCRARGRSCARPPGRGWRARSTSALAQVQVATKRAASSLRLEQVARDSGRPGRCPWRGP